MEQIQQDVTPLEIGHVAIVVRDREKAIQQLQSLSGIGPFRLFDSDHPEGMVRGKRTYYKGKIAYAQAGAIEIELIEPGEGESIWWEFLRAKGEGVHHLGMHVSDLDKELARFEKMGIGVLQYGETAHIRIAYMDTEGIAGVILELLQSR